MPSPEQPPTPEPPRQPWEVKLHDAKRLHRHITQPENFPPENHLSFIALREFGHSSPEVAVRHFAAVHGYNQEASKFSTSMTIKPELISKAQWLQPKQVAEVMSLSLVHAGYELAYDPSPSVSEGPVDKERAKRLGLPVGHEIRQIRGRLLLRKDGVDRGEVIINCIESLQDGTRYGDIVIGGEWIPHSATADDFVSQLDRDTATLADVMNAVNRPMQAVGVKQPELGDSVVHLAPAPSIQ